MVCDDEEGTVERLAAVLDGPGARRAALALLEAFGDLPAVARAEPAAWSAVDGMGPRRTARLRAALGLATRLRRHPGSRRAPVDGPQDAHAWLAPRLVLAPVEELHALYLDRRHRPLALRALTRGSDRFTVVDPPQIYRPAVALGAAAVVLAHNHPSGDPEPSPQDREVTRRVAQAGRVLGIRLVDHLVVGADGWVSLAERGVLPSDGQPLAASWTA